MTEFDNRLSAAKAPELRIDVRKQKKFYIVGKSLFKKIIVGWVLGGVIGGIFVNYLSDTSKDAINKSVKYVWNYQSIQETEQAYSLLVLADDLSSKDKKSEAKLAYDKSLAMFSKAASEEIPRAMHLLGRLYCLGRAGYIEPDAALAKLYLIKAADAGESYARTLLMEGCRKRTTQR